MTGLSGKESSVPAVADAASGMVGPLSTIAEVRPLDYRTAMRLMIDRHYLHRKTSVSFAYGLYVGDRLMGAVTYGTPPSRHLQKSACPSDPSLVIELNRLWLDDALPRNTASWFVSRTLRMLPARIVVSYADPRYGHLGYVYRALNFYYAGWTDMDRKTPRYDYIPHDPTKHSREAFRGGYAYRVRRVAKVKYWITTGNRSERRALAELSGWPIHDWHTMPPPAPDSAQQDRADTA